MIINDWNELKKSLDKLKSEGKKIVFTNGCFDIIHHGHTQYLFDAKSLGDILIVATNSDSSVRRLKGKEHPIITLYQRQKVLDALKPVDFVTFFDEDTPYNLIKTLLPDILVKGGDWKPEEIVGSDIVLKNGGKVKSLTFVEGISTTKIVQKIIKEYCNEL